MQARELAQLLESHVAASNLVNGLKVLHLTSEAVAANERFHDAVEILKSKGYTARESDFICESRLGFSEYVGFEISLHIDEILSSTSRGYFLLILKNTIASRDSGESFKMGRPNKQLDKDFWSAIYKLSSIGVDVNQKFSDFADDYTCFEFTWSE